MWQPSSGDGVCGGLVTRMLMTWHDDTMWSTLTLMDVKWKLATTYEISLKCLSQGSAGGIYSFVLNPFLLRKNVMSAWRQTAGGHRNHWALAKWPAPTDLTGFQLLMIHLAQWNTMLFPMIWGLLCFMAVYLLTFDLSYDACSCGFSLGPLYCDVIL